MYKLKTCKTCGNEFKQYKTTQKCPCQGMKLYEFKKTPIKKVSDKRKVKDLQYYALRKVFMEKPENQICPITGQQTVEVHHKYSSKDRDKYYLEVSTWLAVSRLGHIWIHENSKEAREKGYLY